MPNHVRNKVTFEGPQEQISRLIEHITTPDKEGKRQVDFNSLLPMPDALQIESGSETTFGIRLFLSEKHPLNTKQPENVRLTPKAYNLILEKLNSLRSYAPYAPFTDEELQKQLEMYHNAGRDIAPARDIGEQAIGNVLKYGAPTWYEWRCENWGTKWNAYDTEIHPDKSMVFLSTAWSMPIGFIMALISYMQNESNVLSGVSFDWVYADEDCGCNTGRLHYDAESHNIGGSPNEYFTPEAYQAYAEAWGGADWDENTEIDIRRFCESDD